MLIYRLRECLLSRAAACFDINHRPQGCAQKGREKHLNYSERQGRKEERIHDFSELQPSNKYIKCVVLTCLRNYRKEIPEIFVLFCNSAEDERDLRIMVTIKQIYN